MTTKSEKKRERVTYPTPKEHDLDGLKQDAPAPYGERPTDVPEEES